MCLSAFNGHLVWRLSFRTLKWKKNENAPVVIWRHVQRWIIADARFLFVHLWQKMLQERKMFLMLLMPFGVRSMKNIFLSWEVWMPQNSIWRHSLSPAPSSHWGMRLLITSAGIPLLRRQRWVARTAVMLNRVLMSVSFWEIFYWLVCFIILNNMMPVTTKEVSYCIRWKRHTLKPI